MEIEGNIAFTDEVILQLHKSRPVRFHALHFGNIVQRSKSLVKDRMRSQFNTFISQRSKLSCLLASFVFGEYHLHSILIDSYPAAVMLNCVTWSYWINYRKINKKHGSCKTQAKYYNRWEILFTPGNKFTNLIKFSKAMPQNCLTLSLISDCKNKSNISAMFI